MALFALERVAKLFSGRISRWVTLLVWILLIGVASSIWPQVNSQVKNNADLFTKDYPSVIADEVKAQEFPAESGVPGLLVWYRETGLSNEDYAKLQQLTKNLTEKPLDHQLSVAPLHQLPPMAVKGFASNSGKSLLLPIVFEDNIPAEELKQSREELLTRMDAIFTAQKPYETTLEDKQNLLVRFTGPVGIQIDATTLFESADFKLLLATVLLVLFLLLLIYRSPILALLPLVGVGFAYGLISPILGWMAEQGWIVVDSQSTSIMSVLLFGAGTDYCLFLIAKYRDNLKHEDSKYVALAKAFSGTSGAIVMSGLTVVISLLTLLLADQGNINRFAVPFSLAILIMMIAAVTIVPALLSILGRVSFFPFIPRTEEMLKQRAARKNKVYQPRPEGSRFGKWTGQLVVKRAWAVVIIVVLVLGGMSAFVPQIKYSYDLLESFPKNIPSREGFTIIGEQFSPGDLAPVTVMADTEGKTAAIAGKLYDLKFLDSVSTEQVGKKTSTIVAYTVKFNDNPYATDVVNQIPLIRDAVVAALKEAGVSHAADKVWLAGQSATQYDTQQANARDTELIVPIVISLIALLLLVYLRSIVATVYLMLTVILSFFSALGVGWIVLHYGFGAEAISGAIPLYAFVFIVALGEDYNIFMISRIWQKRKTMSLKQAISEGVSETSSVITSAGLILAGTFAVLATLPLQVLVQFGTITAIGVLLDTFLVRPFLVPAITAILGKWAFWPSKANE